MPDSSTTTAELTTTSTTLAGLDEIRVGEPTADQVEQWMEAMLPLQLTQVAPEIAPASCDDTWISGVTVLPTALTDGEFSVSCVVSSADPLFISLTDGTICVAGMGETLEELKGVCANEPMFFVGDNAIYEAILTVNGEQLPTPAVISTGIGWTDDSQAEPITSPVVFTGFNALLEMEPGQYSIVAGYRSLDDGSYPRTTTIELTVRN